MTNLTLRGVTKRFGATQVVNDVDLDITAGEMVVFVGPSGCGKSTLLRMIAGLEPVTEGRIEIDGRDVTLAEPVERGLAMVFQSYALYPHMTVAENMGFPLEMQGLAKEDIAARVRATAQTLQLQDHLNRKPKALSGGQRQRVAIGRAIVRNPVAFLFDEPLSNLDAELRVQMRLEIARLHRELKATMIYVTHDQVEAMTLADRIVVLRGGRVEQVGAPLELYDNPSNAFVAGFIGSPRMNLIPATAWRDGDRLRVLLPGAELSFRCSGPMPTDGAAVQLGLRPEHMSVAGGTPLTVTCDTIERLGAVSYLYGRLGDGTAVTAQVDHSLAATATGAQVALSPDVTRAFLFDGAGLRIA
ncbi:ABC transporter ATP-binding protein [Tabrizicola sp. M-4]|uniref:ABC transporter ATP-binding protein n=1 Tax=Tabrizicola sp. M-4 TaxID=3055847 RepID=UPI003DA997FB